MFVISYVIVIVKTIYQVQSRLNKLQRPIMSISLVHCAEQIRLFFEFLRRQSSPWLSKSIQEGLTRHEYVVLSFDGSYSGRYLWIPDYRHLFPIIDHYMEGPWAWRLTQQHSPANGHPPAKGPAEEVVVAVNNDFKILIRQCGGSRCSLLAF